jgi:hypothetical protein
VQKANEVPEAYLRLISRLIPNEVGLTGPNGHPLEIQVVHYVPRPQLQKAPEVPRILQGVPVDGQVKQLETSQDHVSEEHGSEASSYPDRE